MSASYMEKNINIAGKKNPLKIQLWDTAGSERF
jgi:GTPase SAR1 family protein